jgi:hypothetical protein
MSNEHSELLKLLQTHGEQFLESFSLPSASTTSRKRKRNERSPKVPIEDDEEEWGGIVQDNHSDSGADGDHTIFFHEYCLTTWPPKILMRSKRTLLPRPRNLQSFFPTHPLLESPAMIRPSELN